MRPVRGNITPKGPKGIQADFDKIGMIDKKKTCVYTLPIHDKGSLEFALKGIKASRVELRVDGTLISVLCPKYEKDWNEETVTELDFLGDGKNSGRFHRALLDVPVTVTVITEDEKLPAIMIRIVEPSLKWENIGAEIYEEEVCAHSDTGVKKMVIMYHRTACWFR